MGSIPSWQYIERNWESTLTRNLLQVAGVELEICQAAKYRSFTMFRGSRQKRRRKLDPIQGCVRVLLIQNVLLLFEFRHQLLVSPSNVQTILLPRVFPVQDVLLLF